MLKHTMNRRRQEEDISSHHPVERKLLCSTQLRQYKHHIFPGLNLHHNSINTSRDIEDAISFYKKPPAIIRKPLPCLSSCHSAQETLPYNHDSVLKLVREKLSWKSKKKRWTKLARTTLKNKKIISTIETALKKNETITTLPYIVTRLADHAAKNPDEHFKGLYNWYYGNALSCPEINGTSCLLYAGGERLNKFCFSTYERSSSSQVMPQVSPFISISLADEGPIFDIVSHKGNSIIGVRQRNYSYFFSYDNTDEEIALNQCFKVEKNEYPFVSMDVSDCELCTVNSNREVKFWVPNYEKTCMGVAALSHHNSYLPDKFAQIKYCLGSNSQKFAVIDRRKLYFYDKRTGYHSPTSVWDPEDVTEMCEDLSLLVPSLIDGYWYLGMSHTCLLFDARVGFAQKWTHMLPQPPSVGCIQRINKEKHEPKEYLTLATQASNDIVTIHNKWSDGNPKSDVLPVYVPSRIDTLHDARINGLLCDFSFTRKFSHSLIGLTAYKNKKKMGIFSLTSTGDIFHQNVVLNKNETSWNADDNVLLCQPELDHLKKWETDYTEHFQKRKPILKITRLLDLSVVPECSNLVDPEIPHWSAPDLTAKAPWKKSKKNLESYQDLLTSNLIQDFGMDVESEWGSDSEEEIVPDKDQSSGGIDKVSVWLSGVDPEQNFLEEDLEELFERKKKEVKEEEAEEEPFELSLSSDNSVSGMSKASRMSYTATQE